MKRLVRIVALTTVVCVLLLAVWGVVIEPARLVVRETPLALPGWPAELGSLRVAVLSDIHAGAPHIGIDKLRSLAAAVDGSHPDLILLLGDYVTRGVLGARPVEPETTARILATMTAPLGIVAVLGNHDWWYDGPRVRRALEAAGIPILENAARRLEWNGRGVWVVGLADLWTRRPDIDAALRGVADGEPVIVLSHNPDVFPTIPPRVTLTLAGHTHGGQVALPFVGRPIVPSRFGQRYAIGHVEERGRHLFVTPGIGTSIVPVRIGVPPEISLLTLGAAGPGASVAPSAPRGDGSDAR